MDTHPFESSKPVHIGWTEQGDVRIVWEDAQESVLALPLLREKCPCATCQGTHGPPTTLVVRASRGGLPILQGSGKKAPSTEVQSVVPVGNYAIRFTWADGHNAGLYSWRYLRGLTATAEAE